MPSAGTLLLTVFTMLLFAANSLLCRAALRHTGLDPASFTTLRVASAALATWAMVRFRRGPKAPRSGSWISALALFTYAAAFAFAYRTLQAGMGALLLFLAVQATMVFWGFWKGDRLRRGQVSGLLLALAGLALLLCPGLTAPPLVGTVLMLGSGVAWGVYSLRGMGSTDPAGATADNFLRAVPMALLLCLASLGRMHLDLAGCLYALVAGAVASGLGYVLWYHAMQGLKAATAASVQLSVPVITALAGVAVLGEPLSLRLSLASVAILGGIALVLRRAGRTARGAPVVQG
ncbi:MAG: DMT family transporter [Holophaga sp.]|nr:DMT family transporter [Holophaga sp.]